MNCAECMIEKELDVDDRYSVLAGIIQVDEVDNEIVLNEIRLDVAGRRGGKNELFFPQPKAFLGRIAALRAPKKAQGVGERAILPPRGSRHIKSFGQRFRFGRAERKEHAPPAPERLTELMEQVDFALLRQGALIELDYLTMLSRFVGPAAMVFTYRFDGRDDLVFTAYCGAEVTGLVEALLLD